MKVLDESGLVHLKDWTKFAHPISIILGSKIGTHQYSMPEDQQKLIFTSKGDAGNDYFPQYIIWNNVQDTLGPVNSKYFPNMIFNLCSRIYKDTSTVLYYISYYHNSTNDSIYIILSKVYKTSESDVKVVFKVFGKLASSSA